MCGYGAVQVYSSRKKCNVFKKTFEQSEQRNYAQVDNVASIRQGLLTEKYQRYTRIPSLQVDYQGDAEAPKQCCQLFSLLLLSIIKWQNSIVKDTLLVKLDSKFPLCWNDFPSARRCYIGCWGSKIKIMCYRAVGSECPITNGHYTRCSHQFNSGMIWM